MTRAGQAAFFFAPMCPPNPVFDVIFTRSDHVIPESVTCLVMYTSTTIPATTSSTSDVAGYHDDDMNSVMGDFTSEQSTENVGKNGKNEQTEQMESTKIKHTTWTVMADTLDGYHVSYLDALEGLLGEIRGEGGQARCKFSPSAVHVLLKRALWGSVLMLWQISYNLV